MVTKATLTIVESLVFKLNVYHGVISRDVCVSDVTNGNCPDTTVGLHSKRLDSNIGFALSTYSIRISS